MKKKNAIFDLFGTASTMGLHMVSGPLLGGIAGYFFDKFFDTSPFGLIFGFFLGIVAGYKNVMEDSKRLEKERENLEEKIANNTEEEQNLQEFKEYGLFGEEKTLNFDTNSQEFKEIEQETQKEIEEKEKQ